MKKLLLTSLCFIGFYTAKCTHLVGGELFYDCSGNNVHHITLKLFRDCNCVNCAQYGDPEYVTIFDASGNVYTQLAMPLPPVTHIPPNYVQACAALPNICMQEADYTGEVTLPPAAGGYTIVYQRCCRSAGVLNIGFNEGATYTAHIPGSALAICNNSARFDSIPQQYICVNSSLAISYAAADPDGDSLVYSLCNPYDGADGNCPDPSPNGGQNRCSTAPNPPPYASATYIAGYDSANFTNSPSNSNDIKIDSATGMLTGIPNAVGIYDITVCVSEYRNGQLLNILRRDFQVTVAPCNIPIASLPQIGVDNGIAVYPSTCKSLTVSFISTSYSPNNPNSISYHWNFGVPGSTSDTSNLVNPSFTYPDTGRYLIHLIATNFANGQTCRDTTEAWVNVYPYFVVNFSAPSSCVDSVVAFTNETTTTYGSLTNCIWSFGDNFTSNLTNPVHVYTTPGNFTPTLIAQNSLGCKDTFGATISISQQPCLTAVSGINPDAWEITLFPNPVRDFATLSYKITSNQALTLFVWNQLGQLVLQQNLPGVSNSCLLKTALWADGVYSYCVILNGLPIKRDKFVIVR